MQTNTISFGSGSVGSIGLGILAALLVLAVWTNRSVPFAGSERGAFFALAVLGVVMCTLGGIGQTAVPLGWTHPLTLFGTLAGVLALVLIAAGALGRTAFLAPLGPTLGLAGPAVSTERLAIVALGLLMLIKWLVGLTKYFLA